MVWGEFRSKIRLLLMKIGLRARAETSVCFWMGHEIPFDFRTGQSACTDNPLKTQLREGRSRASIFESYKHY